MTEILNSTKIIQPVLDLRSPAPGWTGTSSAPATQTGTRRVWPGTSSRSISVPSRSLSPSPPRTSRRSSRSPAPKGFVLHRRARATTPGPLGDLSDTILLKTAPDARRHASTRSARHRARRGRRDLDRGRRGCGASTGSGQRSPAPRRIVGVVGYTLGRRLSWLARKHGTRRQPGDARSRSCTATGELVARRTGPTSQTCSGRCAAAAALRDRHRDRVQPLPDRSRSTPASSGIPVDWRPLRS